MFTREIEGGKKMAKKRKCGVLLPISSLPSKYGIGCFDKKAYEFVDALKAAGQSYWQILPLGPTSYGDSPYQSFSTFAGNPYFISLEELIKEAKKRNRFLSFCTYLNPNKRNSIFLPYFTIGILGIIINWMFNLIIK